MRKMLSVIVGNFLSICGVALTEPQLQSLEHIMSIICMVLGLLITIVSVVIIPLIKWWKEAKKDGKIDEEEAKEGKNIFLRLIDILKNFFKKKDKED